MKKKFFIRTAFAILAGFILYIFALNLVKIAKPQDGSVVVTMGEIRDKTYNGTWFLALPGLSDVYSYNVWDQTATRTLKTRTADNQEVSVEYTVYYKPFKENCHKLYAEVGLDYEEKIVFKVVEDISHKIIGNYNEWIFAAGREDMRNAIKQICFEDVSKKSLVNIFDLRFGEVKYSPEFEEAINRKTVAAQDTLTAIYRTVIAKETAKQNLELQRADAEGIKLKREAIGNNPFVVNYRMAEAMEKVENLTLINGTSTSAIIPLLNNKK